MRKVVPISKRVTVTLPPALRPKFGFGSGGNPLILIEAQEGEPVLQPASAVTVRALVFPKVNDCPVVITALAAEATVMLTLDRADFHGALGREIYGLMIRTPADFLNDPAALATGDFPGQLKRW